MVGRVGEAMRATQREEVVKSVTHRDGGSGVPAFFSPESLSQQNIQNFRIGKIPSSSKSIATMAFLSMVFLHRRTPFLFPPP